MRKNRSARSVGLFLMVFAPAASGGLAAEIRCEPEAHPMAVAIWRLERAVGDWERRAKGPPGCTPTSGNPVTVIQGATTDGIDVDLLLRGGLAGSVVASGSGFPLPSVAIDVWDSDGDYVGTTPTNAAGVYQMDLSSGIYRVATDNGQGYVDELYDGLWCLDGPPILGLCDPLAGDPVFVIGADPVVTGIDFALETLVIFADGFESGDISTWSGAVP